MASDYIIVSVKLCLDVGNNEYIILCNFDGRSIGGFEVIEGGSRSPINLPPPSREVKKSPAE